MEVLTAVLCDSAADYHGKLCILGAFDTIQAVQFPAVHPHCAIAIRLLFRPGEEGSHRLQISLIDPDGRDVFPQGGPMINFQITQIPEEAFFLSQNFVLNLQGLPLPMAAQYSIDVSLDGQIISRIPLQVVQVRQPA